MFRAKKKNAFIVSFWEGEIQWRRLVSYNDFIAFMPERFNFILSQETH